jgi:hypothetical protein
MQHMRDCHALRLSPELQYHQQQLSRQSGMPERSSYLFKSCAGAGLKGAANIKTMFFGAFALCSLSDERNKKAAGLSIGSAANNYLEGADKVTLLTRAGWTDHGLADYDFFWHPRFYIPVPKSLAKHVFPWLDGWKSKASQASLAVAWPTSAN